MTIVLLATASSLEWCSKRLGSSWTVHENIAFGRPDASREEVVQAAKAANADFFIQQLPDGYDTYLADAGDPSLKDKDSF